MRAEQAERIVNAHGAVMERELGRARAVPASSLPCDRETVKQAIKTYTAALHTIGELSEVILNHLSVGYMELSSFVDDETARNAREGESLLAQPPQRALTDPAFGDKLQRSIDAQEAIHQEGRALAMEFREFLVSISVKPEMGDLDANVRAAAPEVAQRPGMDTEEVLEALDRARARGRGRGPTQPQHAPTPVPRRGRGGGSGGDRCGAFRSEGPADYRMAEGGLSVGRTEVEE